MTEAMRGEGERPEEKRNIYFSKVVDKGLRIPELFRPEVTSLSLKEITEATGINRTSTFRFIDTLIQLGYLRKDPLTKLIKLGPRALNLGQNIIYSFDILQIVQPLIDDVHQKFNVTIDSAVLDDVTFVRLYRKEARDTLIYKLPQVLPAAHLHCTALGKACLSAMSEDLYERALALITFERRTPNSLSNRKALDADLAETRARGFSLNNEEYALGIISIGAPFFSAEKKVLGAVSFDVVTIEYTKAQAEKRFGAEVVRLAQVITAALA
jgi:DNA-binding IclR family transcriptional regulator